MVIVLGFVILVVFTIGVAVNGSEDAFGRAKDLLLFINPIVGVVIGYYFNKATSDARSENAEQNAKEATQTAQKATIERERADELVQKTEKVRQEMRTDLLEMWSAANEMVHELPGVAGDQSKRGLTPLSGGEESASLDVNKTMWKLQEALKRAEKWK
jgi:hypothetical protein